MPPICYHPSADNRRELVPVTDQPRRLAVLIDAENAQAALLNELFAEIAKYGVASVKRAYGDFTSANLGAWKAALLKHSIKPVQQFHITARKNASDIALVIDAMDLVHSKRFDGFCIVSSDSDFTGLASRIREEGLTVYGLGEKKTPSSFVEACEILKGAPKKPGRKDAAAPAPKAVALPPEISSVLQDAVESASDDSGWANLGRVGHIVGNRLPDFDSRSYGQKTLTALLEASGDFELQRRGPKGGQQHVVVRVKAKR
jgi:uncharacterized LabA/DUF88 family protein